MVSGPVVHAWGGALRPTFGLRHRGAIGSDGAKAQQKVRGPGDVLVRYILSAQTGCPLKLA